MAVAALAALAGCALTGCVAEHGRRDAFQHRALAEVASDSYTVHPPDVLRFHAPLATELEGVVQEVRADGKVALPLIGEVAVAGLTPAQIAERVREKLARYYIDPTVVVEVPGQNSHFYYILGEVQWPGPRRSTGRDTLLYAIAQARPTDLAWLSRVQLIRPAVSGDARTVLNVDVGDLIRKGDARDDMLLMEGDIIQVPPTPIAWVGQRVRELMYPVTPVTSAYTAPTNFINSPYSTPTDVSSGIPVDSRRWDYVRP